MITLCVIVDIYSKVKMLVTAKPAKRRVYLIAEAVGVVTVHVRRKCVLSIGDSFLSVDHLLIGTSDGDVNVKKSTLGDLKGKAQLGARLDTVEEALFCMSVDHEKVSFGGGQEGPKYNQ